MYAGHILYRLYMVFNWSIVPFRANTPLFASAETTSVTRRISGTYYLYDGIACKNGRYRITTKPEFCGKAPVGQYVTGYVSWDNFGVIG